MAIDTAQKRASILSFGIGDLLPTVDGSLTSADRLTFLDLYSGITAAEAANDVESMDFAIDGPSTTFTLTGPSATFSLDGDSITMGF